MHFEGLAHMIMEAKRSQHFANDKLEAQESSWYRSSSSLKVQEPENWWCQSQTKFEGLRIRGAKDWEQEKMDVLAQAERVNLPFFCLFVLCRPLKGLAMIICIE